MLTPGPTFRFLLCVCVCVRAQLMPPVDDRTWSLFIQALVPQTDETRAMLMFDTMDLNGNHQLGVLEFMKLHQLIEVYERNPFIEVEPEVCVSLWCVCVCIFMVCLVVCLVA